MLVTPKGHTRIQWVSDVAISPGNAHRSSVSGMEVINLVHGKSNVATRQLQR
jgi:hypothetical protein